MTNMCFKASRGFGPSWKIQGACVLHAGMVDKYDCVRLDSNHIQLWARIKKVDFLNLFLQKPNEFEQETGFEIFPCDFMNKSMTNMWHRSATWPNHEIPLAIYKYFDRKNPK